MTRNPALQQLIEQAWQIAEDGDCGTAVDLMTQAIKQDPTDSSLYNDRHIFLRHLKKEDEARADLLKAIELKPKHAMYYYNHGMLLAWINEKDTALAEYNHAIKLDPLYAHAFYNRALIYFKQDKIDLALQDLGQVMVLTPDDGDPYFIRAVIAHQQWNYDEALVDLDRAIERDTTQARFYQLRASIVELGNPASALEDWNRAIELAPKAAALWIHRGHCYSIMNMHDEALRDFEEALRLAPNHPSALAGVEAAKARQPAHFIW
jgi:Flp pilus assembly protein TadD